jgi:putative transposase
MAATVGVSRSAISRKAIDASIEQLQQLQERRWEDVEILVMYIDGQRFADHHILSAVGVDRQGQKHILGIERGATENDGHANLWALASILGRESKSTIQPSREQVA